MFSVSHRCFILVRGTSSSPFLTHRNAMFCPRGIQEYIGMDTNSSRSCFLPASHHLTDCLNFRKVFNKIQAMLSLLLTLAFAATVAALPAAAASSVLPNPSEVSINGIVYGGTGCPQGSLGSFISADRQT